MRSVAVFFGAVISGLILGLIHPPYNMPFIGVLGLPLAFWLVTYFDRPKTIGYGLGFGYFLITMVWIKEPFQVEAEIFGALGYPAWALMAAGLALFWLPIFIAYKRGAWSVATIFIAMELLRGWIFTGFPWALINYGFVDTVFAMSAQFIGSYGMSFSIFFAALSSLGPSKTVERIAGFVVIILLAVPHYLVGEPDVKTDANLKVTLVQANITQSESFDGSRANEFMDLQISMSEGGADLVIWPEGSLRFSPDFDQNLNAILAQSMNGQHLLYGSFHIDEAERFYNSAYLINPFGEIDYRYDKQHLVPFGEYIPFGNWLLKMGIATKTVTRFGMSKGVENPWQKSQLPLINVLICYEGIFPKYAQASGAFIALITNDSWFGNAGGPAQHLVAAQFRAIESGKPVARTAKTGITALIDAKGKIVASVPLNKRGVVSEKIGPKFSKTIYGMIQDYPIYLIVLIGFIFLWRRNLKW